jgi:ABC-type transport system substrate-binding protein
MKRRQAVRLLAAGGIIALEVACAPPAPPRASTPARRSRKTPPRHAPVERCDGGLWAPWSSWPGVFDFIQHLNIIDPVTVQGPDGPIKPVGTGPFAFVEYAQGDHLRLTKYKTYWRTDQPYLDQIVYSIFKDPQSMAAKFEAGARDGVLTPTLRGTQRYQQDLNKFQVLLNRPAGDALVILCNCSVEPTNNKQLRQAPDYALDRQRIVDTPARLEPADGLAISPAIARVRRQQKRLLRFRRE